MNVNLDFLVEVWIALRYHIDLNEGSEAADSLVDLLIDHGYAAEDIKEAFRGEREIVKSLKNYMNAHENEQEDEDFDEDFDDIEYDE